MSADTGARTPPMAPAIPDRLVAPVRDAATLEKHRSDVADAERRFSKEAQSIGLSAAFAKFGSDDAINLGGPDIATWLIGNEAVGAGVGGGRPEVGSPVSWGPDAKTIVAASGDFGVTIGHIVQNKPGADGKIPPGQPFFTIWKRDSPSGKWLYIAE